MDDNSIFLDILVILTSLAIVTISFWKIKSLQKEFNKEKNKQKITGSEIVRKILDENNLDSVYATEISGYLTDYYDGKRKSLRLSTLVFHQESYLVFCEAIRVCLYAVLDHNNNFCCRLLSKIYNKINIKITFIYSVLLINLFMILFKTYDIGLAVLLIGAFIMLLAFIIELDIYKGTSLYLGNLYKENELLKVREYIKSYMYLYMASIIAFIIQIVYILTIL